MYQDVGLRRSASWSTSAKRAPVAGDQRPYERPGPGMPSIASANLVAPRHPAGPAPGERLPTRLTTGRGGRQSAAGVRHHVAQLGSRSVELSVRGDPLVRAGVGSRNQSTACSPSFGRPRAARRRNQADPSAPPPCKRQRGPAGRRSDRRRLPRRAASEGAATRPHGPRFLILPATPGLVRVDRGPRTAD